MEALSVCRSELKYVLSTAQAARLTRSLDTVLARDRYALQGPYTVRNLYFDSLNNADYLQKMAGVHTRKKIRLRTYAPYGAQIKLEAKRKEGDLQRKDSVFVSREEALRLTRGDASALTGHFAQTPESVRMFCEMQLGCYRPVCLVEYCRMAWTHPQHALRITLDTRIRATESDLNLLRPQVPGGAVTWHSVILEVKYDVRMPSFVCDVLRPYHLTRQAMSKYCMSRPVRYAFDL